MNLSCQHTTKILVGEILTEQPLRKKGKREIEGMGLVCLNLCPICLDALILLCNDLKATPTYSHEVI